MSLLIVVCVVFVWLVFYFYGFYLYEIAFLIFHLFLSDFDFISTQSILK